MRRLALRVIGLTAGLMAAITVWIVMTLPPAAQHPVVTAPQQTFVTGGYHVHSNRSDGSGSVDEIAAAASRAGLQFVILTDHGDATRQPDAPAYRNGVLMIDAVEINTVAGHLVALNLNAAAPYPLAGEARDVVDDVHRLGGWAVAAHPDSPRPDLRWRGGGTAVDGIEWLNVDSEWRGAAGFALGADLARAWLRGPETIASLFKSSGGALERWDTMLRPRDTFSLAALDAHARVGEDTDTGRSSRGLAVSWPGYETMFRTVAQTVALEHPWTQDPRRDADAVLNAIHAGRSFSVVRGWIDAPASFEFRAIASDTTVEFGGSLDRVEADRVTASVPSSISARVVLLKDGREVASGLQTAAVEHAAAGVYRAEVRLDGHAVPWIVSNAIRVGLPPASSTETSVRPPAPAPALEVLMPIRPESWVIEKHPTTDASIAIADHALTLRFQLGGGAPAGQYVALASSESGDAAIGDIVFTASASRPMRVSVQVRLPGGPDGRRWRRSIYVDQTAREFRIPLSQLEPVDRGSSLRPNSARVQSILLVIDTLNARPGDRGELTIKSAAYVKNDSGGRF